MAAMQFEWDDAKRQAISPSTASTSSMPGDCSMAVPWSPRAAPHADEERHLTTGIVDDRFVTVVWTRRNGAIRIISARRTRDAEKRATVRYTAEEIDEMLRRGESQTDWARVDAMTEDELEASIDHDDEGEFDWSTVQVGIPAPQAATDRPVRRAT